ncbi:hypothetical protein VF21_04917 [Pseudogymnoascus sp. 05NY08]|nr:hypothetical protein VF21_04917 [Pseudogymnoascus sp. 05NY08]
MEMKGQWFFNLRSGSRNPTNGGLPGGWLGATVEVGGPGKGSITLNAELIRALLTKDLTEPERVMLVNFGASILTHEIAHAADKHYRERCDPRKPVEDLSLPEPYFEDEALNELGNSMEQNVFKSVRYEIMSNTYGLMLMMFNSNFPSPGIHQAGRLSQYLPPGKELEPHAQVRSLVSIEWMRMLLSDEFWNHYVNRYGGDALIPDAPQADICMIWNPDKKMEYSSNLKENDVFIEPDCLITPGMPHGQKIAYKVANMRRNMQRQARDKLKEISQGQGAPTLAPRAPTPDLLYVSPVDVPRPLTISEMETATRIAGYLRRFQNLLGLHCIATCTEDALWFHLSRLVRRRLRQKVKVSFEDWGYFLRVCNESGKMLSWNPETKLVRALKEGWESQEPAQSPLPHRRRNEGNFNTPEDLQVAIDAVMMYTFDCSSNDRPNRVTWYDEDQLTYDFSVKQKQPGTKVGDFKWICLKYFSTSWTTGPVGCIQYNAPNNLNKMHRNVDSYARGLSETTDIGTILPRDEVRNTINTAFDAVDMAETDIFQHPRRLLIDSEDWWEQALLQLLPAYFSIVPGENEDLIAFTFKHFHSLESLFTLLSGEQVDAVYTFMKTYFENPAAKRKIWPLELRKLYNNHQNDESLRINLPRAFFTSFALINDIFM